MKAAMKPALKAVGAAAVACAALNASAATVTIATLNNPDMIELKKLSPAFEQANPDIKLNWVILEENVLRQRATTDITTGSGQFDVMTIGAYETPTGWKFFGNLLDAEYTEAKVGRRVEMVFEKLSDDITLPQFRLASGNRQ